MFLTKTRVKVRDEDYIYASARAKAREASFMGADGMTRLAAMRDYDAALRFLAENGIAPDQLILKNLGKTFVPQGTVKELEHCCGLDSDGIVEAVLEKCR